PPIIFDGFSKLSTVRFANVDITSKSLQLFLSKCPLITVLHLIGDDSRDFATGNKFTFVELLQCVPLIEFLVIEGPSMKHLFAGGMPHKLPTSLVQLKGLSLGMCYDEDDEVSSA
nr:hypothetical protein [Tanacetum cinerariifolium]